MVNDKKSHTSHLLNHTRFFIRFRAPETPIFDGIFFRRLLSDTILCTDDVIQLDGVRLSNPGGTSNNLVGIICPLVGIGFTELLISGGEGGRGLAPQTPR